jgi:hypothetical protein
MQKHVESETLTYTCQATAKLFRSNKNVEAFVKGGVIANLKHVAKTQEKNVHCLVAAAECLNIISSNKAYAGEIIEGGVVNDIVLAMKNYPDNAKLIEHGLSLLGKLAQSGAANLAALKKLNCVDTLVQAIELHSDDEKILQLGAIALRHLAGENDLRNAFGISLGDNAAVAAALAKLSSLLLVDENVDYLIANSGIGWLVAALQTAVGDQSEIASKILVSGCRALMRMANDENKIYQIMQQGGVKLLIAIISQHAANEDVALAAIQALAKMVSYLSYLRRCSLAVQLAVLINFRLCFVLFAVL